MGGRKTAMKRGKDHISPLTASVTDAPEEASPSEGAQKKGKKSAKRSKKELALDLEEKRLTSMIFGSSLEEFDPTAVADHAIEKGDQTVDDTQGGFTIDRIGESFVVDRDGGDAGDLPLEKGDDSADEESVEPNEEGPSPAWVDDDDEDVAVNLVDSTYRLRKLKNSRHEEGAHELPGSEFGRRLRKKFDETAQSTARTDWARLDGPKDADADAADSGDETDEEAKLMGSTAGRLLASSKSRLPPNILSIVRCPDGNLSDPNKAVVQSVQFHPTSDVDRPLMLTAGLDKTLRFFQVGEEKSEKIHGINFPKMPIYQASFLGDSGNVLVSGRRKFFYVYDAIAGKVEYIPGVTGRDEKSLEQHAVSPDGRTIAFLGNDGYIILVNAKTKQWIADLKINGSVRAVSFSKDNRQVLASGSDGDVYRFDMRTRRCIERFSNKDGTITAAMAVSGKHLAVGAESGVVNLYDDYSSSRDATKSIMNLHTSAECLRFNHDGQILAMSSQRERNALKLVHMPTQSVFSNWPTSKTPLGYVWSMDFSPESRFLAIGNDKGRCLLYRLSHYAD